MIWWCKCGKMHEGGENYCCGGSRYTDFKDIPWQGLVAGELARKIFDFFEIIHRRCGVAGLACEMQMQVEDLEDHRFRIRTWRRDGDDLRGIFVVDLYALHLGGVVKMVDSATQYLMPI